jgi:glycosyltransferase involved in cell wall biosynthesis
MRTKIYYLTRSYYPYQQGGGALMRSGAVKHLRELGWDVTVILPNYNSNELVVADNIIQIPLHYNIKFSLYLERLGIIEDYLDKWIVNAFNFLKPKISKHDVVLSTSGGELGMIKLGSLLKKETDCRLMVNFRDPLAYSLVHGLKLNNKFHVSREKEEFKYLSNSDFVITSSNSNKISLENKFPKFRFKILNNYFGYINDIKLNFSTVKIHNKLRIAYIGNMGPLQKPEILYKIYNLLSDKNVEIYFIGDIISNKKLVKLNQLNQLNVKFIDYMAHEDVVKFLSENIDVGFLCLQNDYLGACVPSKLYEYINLGLPMIGALPDGDGKDLINNNNYGIACNYDDIAGLVDAIKKFTNKEYLAVVKKNILKDRRKWSMKTRINEIDKLLIRLTDGN